MMYKVWCEWDYGQDSSIFTSEETALNYISAIVNAYNGESNDDDKIPSVEDILADGLAGIIPVSVDPIAP